MHCQIHLYLKYLSLKKLKGRLLWHVHQLSRCKMSGVKYLALVYCTFPWIKNIKITFCKYAGFAFWQDLGFDKIKMQHRSSYFFLFIAKFFVIRKFQRGIFLNSAVQTKYSSWNTIFKQIKNYYFISRILCTS